MNVQVGRDAIRQILKSLPNLPGVYKMIDKDKNILYIGKAKNLKNRVSSYAATNLSIRLNYMVSEISTVEYITTVSELDALILEANLIKRYDPKYNIMFRDDKSFPYLKIDDSDQFPKIEKYRTKNPSSSQNIYGPFASQFNLNSIITTVQKIFQIRNCSDYYFSSRKRPCLQYEIKRCTAPCVGKVSQKEYKKQVEQANLFLRGKKFELQEVLLNEMQKSSENLEYENAALVRDRISAIKLMQKDSNFLDTKNYDVIGFYTKDNNYCIQLFIHRARQNYGNKTYYGKFKDTKASNLKLSSEEKGEVLKSFIIQHYQNVCPPEVVYIPFNFDEKKIIESMFDKQYGQKVKIIKENNNIAIHNANYNARYYLEQKSKVDVKHKLMLKKISALFNLNKSINRVEVYDNSHIMGNFATGVVIVAGKNGFDRSEYRCFSVPNKEKVIGDDYEMLREVLRKRIEELSKKNMPDLIIIDGGKGHLNVAYELLKHEPKIHIVSMSKGKERRSGKEIFHQIDKESFTLPSYDSVMQYMQVLRDEAHNFAIKNYRKKHQNNLYVSKLDAIEGVGKVKKSILLNHFGSVEKIKNSSMKDIAKVSSIGVKLAEKILQGLK